MTREEAIKVLQREKECVEQAVKNEVGNSGYVSPDGIIRASDYVEACAMALSALREQDHFLDVKKMMDNADRLAAYEATGLEPGEIRSMRMDMAIINALFHDAEVERMKELTEADKDGRLAVLPCKVGDTVYSTLDDLGRLHECEVRGVYKGRKEHESYVELEPVSYRGRNYGAAFGSFGKTVFLTREEAEAALKGGDGNG